MHSMVREILSANIYELVKHSPLEKAKGLSSKLGHDIYMKREDLQSIFSFKIRGAFNKIKKLSSEEKARGLACVSAGNHAQGVALSAKTLGIKSHIVMPITTPKIKIEAVKRHGAKVELYGDTYSEAESYCKKLVETHNYCFIHPFDDKDVISGQGTIGREILQDLPDVDRIFIPIGGGGLFAGIASYVKFLNPKIKVIGVEPFESDGMYQSLQRDKRVTLTHTGTFADGVSVKQVGALTFELVKELCDGIIRVTNDEICSAIENVYQETRSILEPSGALALAGLKRYVQNESLGKKEKLVCINSGANMNFQRMQFVAERVLSGEGEESLYGIELPEVKGALYRFCEVALGELNITEFNYRSADHKRAFIFVGIANLSLIAKEKFEKNLQELNYRFFDITQNELAKQHIRHMVGGQSSCTKNEVLYRFQFPERPLALREFLKKMGSRWNISLFHYRSHGADFGRVLMGLEVSKEDRSIFMNFLEDTKYPYENESTNIAYQLFLDNKWQKDSGSTD